MEFIELKGVDFKQLHIEFFLIGKLCYCWAGLLLYLVRVRVDFRCAAK